MYMPDNSTNAAMMATDVFGIIHVTALRIIIDGRVLHHYESFELDQSASSHHSFKLLLQHDILGRGQDQSLEDARDLLGKRISITFSYKNALKESPEREFIGVIMQVGFTGSHGHKGSIVLIGQSPTALLDAAPHTQSFGGVHPVSLHIIADSVIKQGLGETKYDINIQPSYTGNLSYSCQYNETNYNYLCRIAASYGQWFFYDGQVLHFGKPATADPIRLIYGKDTDSVQLQMHAQHVNRSQYGYNSSADKKLTAMPIPAPGLDELGRHAYNTGKKLFTTASQSTAPLKAVTDNDVEAAQNSINGSVAAESFTLTGTTTVPFLYPGCLVEMNFRKPESSDVKYFSRLIVTAVKHSVDMRGNYKGQFTAIPSDTGYLPEANYKLPQVYPQLASVISNADGEGRVQVQFHWQRGQDMTDFIRVATPDAGSSDAVGTNRGFVFIPEEGDQVMVNFTEGHPDRPFVQSAMFHGKNGRGGEETNHKKTIITRSGSVIQFDDTEGKGSIYIADPSGNTWHMDGAGNISVNAPKNIMLNAGENISFTAGMNISASAGLNILESAGENKMLAVGMILKTDVGGNHLINVVGDSIETIRGDFKSEVKERTEIAKKGHTIQSSEDSVYIKASEEIQKHSGEKSLNS